MIALVGRLVLTPVEFADFQTLFASRKVFEERVGKAQAVIPAGLGVAIDVVLNFGLITRALFFAQARELAGKFVVIARIVRRIVFIPAGHRHFPMHCVVSSRLAEDGTVRLARTYVLRL